MDDIGRLWLITIGLIALIWGHGAQVAFLLFIPLLWAADRMDKADGNVA